MSKESILFEINRELERAKKVHPEFPESAVERVAIMAEEAGEAIRAANNYTYHNGLKDEIKTELIQTASTCIRILEAMEKDE